MPSTCHKKPLKHFELKSRYTGKKVYRTSLKLVRARGPSQECPGRSKRSQGFELRSGGPRTLEPQPIKTPDSNH